jgi:pSer/pThr/pTyr-binding forkhead associated (FHA) protein
MPTLVLECIRPRKEMRITKDCIIGRNGDVDKEFFKNQPYISNEHCLIAYKENEWQVEHLSHKNQTAVNGKELYHNEPRIIQSGDHLRLADLLFKVSISAHESVGEQAAGQQDSRVRPPRRRKYEYECRRSKERFFYDEKLVDYTRCQCVKCIGSDNPVNLAEYPV